MANQNQKKILLALDGSDRAFETVRYICHIPPFQKMRVVLFTVFSKIPDTYWDMERQPNLGKRIGDVRAWERQKQAAIKEYMKDARQKLMDGGFSRNAVTVKIQERKEGIAQDIIKEAKTGYDAVAIGRKGMSKLKELVLGSVATRLLEKLEFVPLFVVGRCQPPMKILLALDSSEASARTVDYVGATLSGCDCDVTLTHVVRGEERVTVEEATKKIGPVFNMAKNHLIHSGFNPSRIDTKIITGVLSRAGALVHEAEDGGYCTIVVGRKGMSKVSDFFIGRVSNKVVQLGGEKVVWVVS
jgi:nucleotide-binding universal stress UspA family protein